MIGTVPLQSGEITELATAIDNTWVLTVTFLIFFMHAGFAMLESGQVRSKNVANQLTKNLLTWSVGVVVFFLIGVGAANLFAGNGFAAGAPFLNLESAGSYIGDMMHRLLAPAVSFSPGEVWQLVGMSVHLKCCSVRRFKDLKTPSDRGGL